MDGGVPGSAARELAEATWVGSLPDFVTREWVERWVTSEPNALRRLHSEVLESKRAIFPPLRDIWPRSLDHATLASLVWLGLRHCRGLLVNDDGCKRSFSEIALQPFTAEVGAIHREAHKRSKATTPGMPDYPEFIRIAMETGHDDFLRFNFLYEAASSRNGCSKELVDNVRGLGPDFADLADHLDRMRERGQGARGAVDRHAARSAAELRAALAIPKAWDGTPVPSDIDPDIVTAPACGSTTIAVPGHVTPEWIGGRFGLSGHVKSTLHQNRYSARALANDDAAWPEERLEAGPLAHVLANAMRHPLVLPGIRAALGADRSSSLFRAFYKECENLATRCGPGGDGIAPPASDEALFLALAARDPVTARDFATLRGAETLTDGLLHVMRSHPDPVHADTTGFLLSRKRAFHLLIKAGRVPENLMDDMNFTMDKAVDVDDQAPLRPDAATTVAARAVTVPRPATPAEAQDVYSISLDALAAEAGAARALPPGLAQMDALRDAMAKVEAAYLAFEALPKGIDATPLLARLAAIREALIPLADEFEDADGVSSVPGTPLVTDEGAARVGSLATAGEGTVERARDTRAEAVAIQAQMTTSKLSAARALTSRFEESWEAFRTSYKAAHALYEDAVAAVLAGAFDAAGQVSSAVGAPSAEGRGEPPVLAEPVPDLPVGETMPAGFPTRAGEVHVTGDVVGGPAGAEASAPALTVASTSPGIVPDPASLASAQDDVGCVDGDATAIRALADLDEPDGGNLATPAEPALEEETEESVSADDVSMLASLAREILVPTPRGRDGADPEGDTHDSALRRLVRAGEYGLAHHLGRAVRTYHPGVRLAATPEAMFLAAMSGNMNHSTLQSNHDRTTEWVHAYLRADEAGDEGAAHAAMRFVAWPAAIELALFHRNSGAMEILRGHNRIIPDLNASAKALAEAVGKFTHSNLTLTQTMLASVDGDFDRHDMILKLREELVRRTGGFGKLQFNFTLGTRMRNTLVASDGAIGRLHAGMVGDDHKRLAAAAEYADLTPSRSSILDVLGRIEQGMEGKTKAIVGAGREKMINHLGEIHDLSARYVELVREMDDVRKQERPRIREMVTDIRRRLADFLSQVESLDTASEPGLAAPAVAKRLRGLDSLLSGNPSDVGSTAWLLASNGCLALVPGLHFGRSWLPTPYEPGVVADLISSAPVPACPPRGAERDAWFADALRARTAQASYVGAHTLIGMAKRLGIAHNVRQEMEDTFTSNLEVARDALATEIAQTRAIVERVQRFGALDTAESEATEALMDRIRRVQAADVPALLPPEDRSVQPDGARIGDMRLAFALLDEVRSEAGHLLEEPRNELLVRISNLEGKLPSRDLEDLRRLCAEDELHTVEELVEQAERTGSLPEPSMRTVRFRRFEAAVACMATLGKDITTAARQALNVRGDICGIDFGQSSQARSEAAAALFDQWYDIGRQLGSCRTPAFGERFTAFLDGLGIGFRSPPRIVDQYTNPNRKVYVADGRATVPLDAESLLMPDFGSRVQGHRVVLAHTMPSDAALNDICRSASTLGVLLFVAEVVGGDDRAAFLQRNLKAERRILLIDTASVLFSLGEAEQRALTLLELGQPYSYVAPYKDWQKEAVPPEMFVGRQRDMIRVFEPDGSCVVYGGRRMGKTAMLKHIQATRNNPDDGVLVGYVDAQELVEGPNLTGRIWPAIARSLPALFPKGEAQADQAQVVAAIKKWIAVADNRRILLEIDESDRFVVADAAQGYSVFVALQSLMTETRRRFKLVLAGLSDVTRLVQAGNPPLRQIAADPCRIGALLGADLRDAESLVIIPFAAMGMDFEERGDVWAILSHANYYPVLVQTYSQKLLDSIVRHVKGTGRPMRTIPHDLVKRVLDDNDVRKGIKEIFSFTLQIDPRYHLIAYAVADHVLSGEQEGALDTSMSILEIRDAAIQWWPEGFKEQQRTTLFADLVDEMEGLGILKQDSRKRWTLRTSAILSLIGSRDEIHVGLLSYEGRAAPREYDPKSMRREFKNAHEHVSPLTLSQERDVVVGRSPIHVVLGNDLADVGNVAGALRSAVEAVADGNRYEVDVTDATDGTVLVDHLRRMRVRAGERPIVVVPNGIAWTPQWVSEVLRVKNVVDGQVQVVFVGGPSHAALVADDARLRALPPKVRLTPLEPWSDAYLDHRAKRNDVSWTAVAERSHAVTGDWNMPLTKLFGLIGRMSVGDRVDRLARVVEEAGPDKAGQRLGLTGPYGTALEIMAGEWGANPFRAVDVDDVVRLDDRGRAISGDVSGEAVICYGLSLGILAHVPPARGAEDRGQSVCVAPFALRLLTATGPGDGR